MTVEKIAIRPMSYGRNPSSSRLRSMQPGVGLGEDLADLDAESVNELIGCLRERQNELVAQNAALVQEQEAIQTLHKKYYDLYELAPVGYLTIDIDGNIRESNLMACTLLGAVADDLRGKDFRSFIASHSLETCNRHFRKVFENFPQQTCEVTLSGINAGTTLQLNSLRGPQDSRSCRMAVIDISKAQKMGAALTELREQAQESSAAKSAFLANISHEMRTPLNVVVGLSALLGRTQPLSAKQVEYISTLQISAQALLKLINELLDISEMEKDSIALDQKTFHLPDILQETRDAVLLKAQQKNLEVILNIDHTAHNLFQGDPARIRQIILNLLSNAIKFTERGEVTLSYYTIARTPGKVDAIVTVSDTGVGIARDKHQHIFETFTQVDSSISRRFGGTGISLAISKKLIDRMGGTISLRSEPGRGSTFTVCLPLPASL